MLNGTPTRAGGFPSQRAVAAVRAADRRRPVADRPLRGPRCWKLACIAEGIAATGPGPDDHAEADRMTAKVTPLAEAALVALQRTV
jgi:hypothetical protein